MRKNLFEEELFKCEDQRFEIDMVIDTNAASIRALEPLADEIAALKTASGNGGMPLHRYQFKLDDRGLSTVHLASIARVYGEQGNAMMQLLKKNPIGAIPVALRRLKQKDLEWRKARQDLNKQVP